MLYVEIPETSGLDIAYLSSPIVTMGCYDGDSSDFDAPNWTTMSPGIPFELRQPRTAMANVFQELAFWPENTGIVHSIAFLSYPALADSTYP